MALSEGISTATCLGKRVSGDPCSSTVVLGNGYCVMHQDQAPNEETQAAERPKVSMGMTSSRVKEIRRELEERSRKSDPSIDLVDGDIGSLSISESDVPDEIGLVLVDPQTDEEETLTLTDTDVLEIVVPPDMDTPEEKEPSVRRTISTARSRAKVAKPKKAKTEAKAKSRKPEAEYVTHFGYDKIRKRVYPYGEDYKEPDSVRNFPPKVKEALREQSGRTVVVETRSKTRGVLRREIYRERAGTKERDLITTVLNGGKADKRARRWARALGLVYTKALDWEIVEINDEGDTSEQIPDKTV